MKEFKALNPDGDIVFGPAPIGPDGKSGTEGWNKTGRLTVITTKCASDPRKVDAFLAMLDAYYSDPDYARLVNYGIEGRHFASTEYGNVRLMEGTELRQEGVLQVDFGSTSYFAENVDATKTAFGHSVTGNGYWRYNVPACEEYSSVIATLDTLTEQAFFDMITGAKPIDYFDTFVEQFKAAGGAAAEQKVQELDRIWQQGGKKEMAFNELSKVKGEMHRFVQQGQETKEQATEVPQLQEGDDVLDEDQRRGTILEVRKNMALIDYDGLRIRRPLSGLRKAKKEKRAPKTYVESVHLDLNPSQGMELNVIGLHVDEAMRKVVSFLDSARVRRLSFVRIIHGAGTFALKNAVWKYLQNHSEFVKDYRLGGEGEGGLGATVVHLR